MKYENPTIDISTYKIWKLSLELFLCFSQYNSQRKEGSVILRHYPSHLEMTNFVLPSNRSGGHLLVIFHELGGKQGPPKIGFSPT